MARVVSRTITSTAVISSCGNYRYLLTRHWAGGVLSPATFIMLNPSTADAEQDDPTIRRCLGFAEAQQASGIRVVNLFAWRATDKSQLVKRPYDTAIGPDNDEYIRAETRVSSIVIAAWGSHSGEMGKWVETRSHRVKAMFTQIGRPIFCLGRAQNGQPRHPLYLPKNSHLEVWAA